MNNAVDFRYNATKYKIVSLIIRLRLRWNTNIAVVSLTHWSQVTHIGVIKLTIIGSDNGLSPSWCQAIIWTNAILLPLGTSGANFSEIFSELHAFSFEKVHLQMLPAKWRQLCLGLNVLQKHPDLWRSDLYAERTYIRITHRKPKKLATPKHLFSRKFWLHFPFALQGCFRIKLLKWFVAILCNKSIHLTQNRRAN